MVELAQLVSAPDCGSGDQGFESLIPPFFNRCCLLLWGYRQVVRHSTLTAVCAGSNPASPAGFSKHKGSTPPVSRGRICYSKGAALTNHEILAQLVEHLTFNQVVGGSTPPCLTSLKPVNAGFFLCHDIFHIILFPVVQYPLFLYTCRVKWYIIT